MVEHSAGVSAWLCTTCITVQRLYLLCSLWPMYLGLVLVFFTDKTGTSLMPCATLSLVPFPTSSHSNFSVPKLDCIRLVRVLRHSQQCCLRFKHVHTHARNYRISTVHTYAVNTLQRYVSARRLGFFFPAVGNENGKNVLAIEETHERCEIHQKSMEWIRRMNSAVAVTVTNSDFLQYEIPGRIDCMANTPWKEMLLETWTMWRQYEQSVTSISNSY